MKYLQLVPLTTQAAGSGRRPHYCRIPIQRFRKRSLRRRGWVWCGQIWAIEKEIAGRMVLGFVEAEHVDHVVCKFMLYDDFWAEYIRYARDQEAIQRRRAFEVVDVAGRRPASRFFPCMTVLLDAKGAKTRS